MSGESHRVALRIPPDHPVLAGHFPDAPIVPGVVLLDQVLSAAERCLARPVSARVLQQAKFPASLRPGQEASLELRLTGTELRFAITHAAQTIAQGIFTIDAAPDS